MEKGTIQVYYGNGQGKSAAALGNAIRFASQGKKCIIIQFLKSETNTEYFEKLEPEIKLFRFERSKDGFENLTDEQKQEEKINILNGLNYAKKVLGTGECDLLVLDEVLGVLDEGIVAEDAITDALEGKSLATNVIITGQNMSEGLFKIADNVLKIESEK
ncbi:MAG: cob(I)yrinic acid a,c-diamide adenosyltransferase [Pseudobutyrivibrio sp.]|uniref:cob(I)yrinic acid a,c-diamide adenosyltransferase n=1 Tax=Pseudobutyrivibrio sp. TaxID=2014367 RepID=UPI001B079BB9|nr:cob(I)yrinic acid a,c-diamide adenosyltransferase [Pseudobutyrivibrio sp.]MBO6283910.1 cob(I)yrinic acid a,c-diamide adenosyltransferase [Pseudobutyrivibrio sp.]MBP3261120.1 cob(I)yrinic acid a,c-diamide adenosyltransferase [Pseudobutyrivibrio sp.]